MSKGKVLFVVTNHSKLGNTDKKTGWYLPEAAHPYNVLTSAGYHVDFLSPKGGKAPMDPGSADMFKDDPDCTTFLKEHASKMDTTLAPSAVKAGDYKGLFYVGGHGPMFDLHGDSPEAVATATLAAAIYEQGGILGAVCHGTVGFVPIKLSGKPLVEKQTVTSFTDAEEKAVNLSKEMPFLLETKLKELGANFVGADLWASNVQVSGRLVTGQNPASANATAEKMVELLKDVK